MSTREAVPVEQFAGHHTCPEVENPRCARRRHSQPTREPVGSGYQNLSTVSSLRSRDVPAFKKAREDASAGKQTRLLL